MVLIFPRPLRIPCYKLAGQLVEKSTLGPKFKGLKPTAVSFPFETVLANIFSLDRVKKYHPPSLYLYQSISINISLSIYFYQSISINLSLSIYLYQSISINLSLSIYLYQSISIDLSLSIYFYQSIYINLSLSICLYLSMQLSICQ
jgi:hypothetical protein